MERGLGGPEVQSTRGSSPCPLVRLGPGWRSPCARAEAAGDPEEARAAVRSGLCGALRGRRPLRPVPAPPRAAASEAESRERAGLSQPASPLGPRGRGRQRAGSFAAAAAARRERLWGSALPSTLPGRLPALPKCRLRRVAGPDGPGRLLERCLEFWTKSKLGSFRRNRLTSKRGQ